MKQSPVAVYSLSEVWIFFINVWNFCQGLRSYHILKRLTFYCISFYILRGYIYSFCQILQTLLRLFNIPDSRVIQKKLVLYTS